MSAAKRDGLTFNWETLVLEAIKYIAAIICETQVYDSSMHSPMHCKIHESAQIQHESQEGSIAQGNQFLGEKRQFGHPLVPHISDCGRSDIILAYFQVPHPLGDDLPGRGKSTKDFGHI